MEAAGRHGNYFKLPGCQRAPPAQPRSEDAGDAIRGVCAPSPAGLLGLLHRSKKPGEAGRVTHPRRTPLHPQPALCPPDQRVPARDPGCGSGRSPPSPAWLPLLCSLTYFLPLSLPSVTALAAENPKISHGSNPELTETPEVGRVVLPRAG